jgi:hypothetical protein
MSNPATCEQFDALRASAESLKAARSFQDIALSAKELHSRIEETCGYAFNLIDEQIRQAQLASLFLNPSQAQASGTSDLAKMESERDLLLMLLKRECRHCDGFSPFSDEPCCEDRKAAQSGSGQE